MSTLPDLPRQNASAEDSSSDLSRRGLMHWG